MTRIARTLIYATALLTMASAVGCSKEDEQRATDAAETAVEKAEEAAGDAADAVKEGAADAAKATQEAAGDAAEMAETATDEASSAAAKFGDAASLTAENALGDSVAACRRLAADEKWAEALVACTKAHAEVPDDPTIEQALQQATAAGAGTL
jgi:hypothetical protein